MVRVVYGKDTERDIEHYFIKRLTGRGESYKWVSPGVAGVPDRIVFFPGGAVHLVEFKAPGEAPRKLQQVIFRRLARLGIPVTVLDSRAAVDAFLEVIP